MYDIKVARSLTTFGQKYEAGQGDLEQGRLFTDARARLTQGVRGAITQDMYHLSRGTLKNKFFNLLSCGKKGLNIVIGI